MAKWGTDPSFQYTAQLSKSEGNQQPIRVSSRKTDLSPSNTVLSFEFDCL
jgi:hypothetical protein